MSSLSTVQHQKQQQDDDVVVLSSSQLTPSPSTTTTTASATAAPDDDSAAVVERKRHAKDRFRYGNYNRYYGVRNQGLDHDPRVDLLPVQWFRGRRVLDIGCNVGHLTLEIAKKLGPGHILGIDIDAHLVGVARKNIRHYCDGTEKLIGKFPASLLPAAAASTLTNLTTTTTKSTTTTTSTTENGTERHGDECSTTATQMTKMEVQQHNGETVAAAVSSCSSSSAKTTAADDRPALPYDQFPKNVWFLRENYVLDCDEFLEMVREEYDVILALSITKWVHLNWGDDGLKRFLRRTFLSLRPGGRLLLEAQPFPSYYKKAKMTPDMFETYKTIKFKPYQFKEFLLSDAVGFSECEELGAPTAVSKGFERSILVFKKSSTSAVKRKKAKASSKIRK